MQRLRNGEISHAEKKSEKHVTHDMPMRSYRHAQQAPGESAEAFGERILKLARSAHPEATEKQLQATALEHFMCGLSDLTLQERLPNRDDIVSLNTAIVAANNYQKKEAILAYMRTTQGSSMAMAACQTKPLSRRVTDTQGHNSK